MSADLNPSPQSVGLDGGVDNAHLFVARLKIGEADLIGPAVALGLKRGVVIPEQV